MFCPQCGNETTEGQVFCPACGARIVPIVPVESVRKRTHWEDRETAGFFSGMFATLKESLFNPGVFFKTMAVRGGLTDPLLYALFTCMAGIMTSYFWQTIVHDMAPGFMSSEMQEMHMFRNISMAVVAVLIPFCIIAGVFIWTAFLHLLLMLVRGSQNGFEATFRAVSYSLGAMVFMIVPICGGFIALPWILALTIIGLKFSHGTTGGKASFVVLFPLLFCCGAVLLLAMLIAGTMAVSLGGMAQ